MFCSSVTYSLPVKQGPKTCVFYVTKISNKYCCYEQDGFECYLFIKHLYDYKMVSGVDYRNIYLPLNLQ